MSDLEKYKIVDYYTYKDEEGHMRLIISVRNKQTKEDFDIMVKDTGLIYVMEV